MWNSARSLSTKLIRSSQPRLLHSQFKSFLWLSLSELNDWNSFIFEQTISGPVTIRMESRFFTFLPTLVMLHRQMMCTIKSEESRSARNGGNSPNNDELSGKSCCCFFSMFVHFAFKEIWNHAFRCCCCCYSLIVVVARGDGSFNLIY